VSSRSCAADKKADELTVADLPKKEIHFPAGLLGFPDCQRFKLERFKPGDGSESPFFVLSAVDQELSFPVIHPASIALNYPLPVAVNRELLSALGAQSEQELIPLLIVTVRDKLEEMTVNLQGPLVINPASSCGMQLVLDDFPLRHPLLINL
jgi:flagellar assembly factor FliW